MYSPATKAPESLRQRNEYPFVVLVTVTWVGEDTTLPALTSKRSPQAALRIADHVGIDPAAVRGRCKPNTGQDLATFMHGHPPAGGRVVLVELHPICLGEIPSGHADEGLVPCAKQVREEQVQHQYHVMRGPVYHHRDLRLERDQAPQVGPVVLDGYVQRRHAVAVRQVQVQAIPWPAGERCRPHPQAAPRAVGPRRGFRFQPMRSTWRQPGRHVTVYRAPEVHCGFPDVAVAGPDHLVCVWRNGSHTGGTGGLSVAHSHDCGRTWSAPILFRQ